MRPGTPDSGQAAERDSLWVLDIGSGNHGRLPMASPPHHCPHPLLLRQAGHSWEAGLCNLAKNLAPTIA